MYITRKLVWQAWRIAATALIAMAGMPSIASAQAEPGISSTAIRFGQTLGVTGVLASLSNDLIKGSQLYFNYINAKGGIKGRKVELITLDDSYDPEKAKANVQQLIDKEGVFAIFQLPGTGALMKIAPYMDQRQVPLCAAMGTGPELRAMHFKNVFYVRAGNSQEIAAIAKHLQTIGLIRVAVVYLNAEYGLQGREVAIREVNERGLRYVADAAVPASTTDPAPYQKAAETVANSKPDAVLLVTAGKSSVESIRWLQKAGLRNQQIYGLASTLSDGDVATLGDTVEGVVLSQLIPSPNNRGDSHTLAFREAAEKAGVRPTRSMLEGWINASVCAAALERAGSTPTRASYRKALESLDLTLNGMRVHFNDKRHDGSSYVDLTYVRGPGKETR